MPAKKKKTTPPLETHQRQRPLDRFLRVSRDDDERRQLRRHPRQIFKQRRFRVPRLVQREAFQVREMPDRDQEVGKVVGPDGSFEEEFFEREGSTEII